jgi:hypothetical protein
VLALVRIGERAGHTEAGCIVAREERRRCVDRRGLDALHIYFTSMLVCIPHISTSAMEGFVGLWSKFEVGGLTRIAVT